MCFKNNKKHHINKCLATKLISMVIHWSFTYVKSNLANMKKISDKFVANKLYFQLKNKNGLHKQVSPRLG